MYRCSCGVVTQPGKKAKTVVKQARNKQYPERFYKLKASSDEPIHDPGGIGWEIVEEVKVCGVCAAKIEEEEERAKALEE